MEKRDLSELRRTLQDSGNPDRARINAWFFKTKPGEYGEGDQFLGLRVPELRALIKPYRGLALEEIGELLNSPWHEERLAGALLLTESFKKATAQEKKAVFDFYLSHTNRINNWDLVDSSAPGIVGAYLWEKQSFEVLDALALSPLLWERRIAMIACLHFIRQKNSTIPLKIAEKLLNDQEDLMHKAVGWMLRELGKHCGKDTLVAFLKKNYNKLPRTTLRYAIEHFPSTERKAWLKAPVA